MGAKINSAILGIGCLLALVVPTFGSLILSYNAPLETSVSSDETLRKITFKNVPGQGDVVKYFNDGYDLSLADAPTVFNGNQVIDWVSGSKKLSKHILVDGADIDLNYESASSQSLSSNYDELYSSGSNEEVNTAITSSGSGSYRSPNAGLDHAIDVVSPQLRAADGGTNFRFFSESSGDMLTSSRFNPDEDAYCYRGGSYPNGIFNCGKSTIGLETNPADYPYGTNLSSSYNQYYKPIDTTSLAGNSVVPKNQSEYCFGRITLQCDTVLIGNLTLGAQTGFPRQDGGDTGKNLQWTQLNSQGFICGPYSEIDLNGYDLIVSNGSMIDAFGSITDSSSARSGCIVMQAGSTLYADMVIEDMWRENAIPEIYSNSMDFLQVSRIPYLDCKIRFEAGAYFYGKLFVSFGKSSGAAYSDIGLIGPSNSDGFLMQLSSGTIERNTFYNTDLYDFALENNVGTDLGKDRTIADITYQKISYSFVDSTVIIGGLKASVSIGNNNVSIDSRKFQKWLAPYYDFYSFNSDLTITQEFDFMPGCYAYADSDSQLTFSYSQLLIDDMVPYSVLGNPFNSIMTYADDQYSNPTGGLFFSQSCYTGNSGDYNKFGGADSINWTSSNLCGWFDCRKSITTGTWPFEKPTSNEGYGVWAWLKRPTFWNYYNDHPAIFDCCADIVLTPQNKIPYVFGGQINFADESKFESAISVDGVKTNLYGSSAVGGPSVAALGNADIHQTNILSFASSPLISNGRVLTEMPGDGKDYSFDPSTGIVKDDKGNTYGFVFNSPNESSNNTYYSYNSSYESVVNSFDGSFVKLNVKGIDNPNVYTIDNASGHVNSGKDVIFFQGAFIPYRGGQGSLLKFGGHDSGSYDGKKYMYRTFSFQSGSWTITGNVTSGTWSW